MSAFIVSDNHIHAIVNYVMRRGYTGDGLNVYGRLIGVKHRTWATVETIEQATMLGQFFMNANYESYNARYKESGDAHQYRFQSQPVVSTLQFIKALHCLDYQCCETDDYKQSDCCKLILELTSEAAKDLPGYGHAQWEIK